MAAFLQMDVQQTMLPCRHMLSGHMLEKQECGRSEHNSLLASISKMNIQ